MDHEADRRFGEGGGAAVVTWRVAADKTYNTVVAWDVRRRRRAELGEKNFFMELDMTKGMPSRLDALAAVGATGSVVFLILGFTQGCSCGWRIVC